MFTLKEGNKKKKNTHGAEFLREKWLCDGQRSSVDQTLPGHEVQHTLHLLDAADAHQTADDDVLRTLLHSQHLLHTTLKSHCFVVDGDAACCRTSGVNLAVPVPRSQDQVSQSQVHGGISGKLWKLVELVQLHHVWSDTQSFPTLVRLVERLEVRTQTWN